MFEVDDDPLIDLDFCGPGEGGILGILFLGRDLFSQDLSLHEIYDFFDVVIESIL